MKKILLFQFSETGWNIAAAELEQVEKHLKAGDDIKIVNCSGECYGCDVNLTRKKLLCYNCKLQSQRGINALSKSVSVENYTNYLTAEDHKYIKSVENKYSLTQQELREYKYESFDLGEAVISILVSRSRDGDVEPINFANVTKNLLKAGMAAYIAADKVIKEYQPDDIYFFNGRGSQQRAFLRASEKHGVSYTVVEEGCDTDHYALFKGHTPHDINGRVKSILEHWDTNDKSALKEKADNFFQKRASGYNGYGFLKNYTGKQKSGQLPEQWNEKIHNIVVFCSSDDEFAAVGNEWKSALYGSQLEGLKQLSKSASNFGETHKIYLRMHPNLSGLHNRFRQKCLEMSHDRFEIIPPESEISTYSLLFNCDCVVSFGSTVGIEAAYWGIPSVLLGSCFYKNLGSCYVPETHDETLALIQQKLEPLPNEGALMFASYLVSFGHKFEMSKTGAIPMDVRFRGVHLRGNWLFRQILSLRHKLFGPTIDFFRGKNSEL